MLLPSSLLPTAAAPLTQGVLCACSKGHLVALDIIRGLVFLHSNKVVHADLKAKNVLLTQNAGKSIPTAMVTAVLLLAPPSVRAAPSSPPVFGKVWSKSARARAKGAWDLHLAFQLSRRPSSVWGTMHD